MDVAPEWKAADGPRIAAHGNQRTGQSQDKFPKPPRRRPARREKPRWIFFFSTLRLSQAEFTVWQSSCGCTPELINFKIETFRSKRSQGCAYRQKFGFMDGNTKRSPLE
ncbi:hypothetical protein [Azospirillum doebereinerae]|uniref:Uncharacterized protein n=1 Tax=Azospirillum doebereinerae TaxID=92933 RepID=A0A3S0XEK7_9PROT|nr:hypothetical protein [Azospirillum doebereinerae]RUQ75998.1 hypothetical protein EJ913_02480 [Azospirillum doebereinerae]